MSSFRKAASTFSITGLFASLVACSQTPSTPPPFAVSSANQSVESHAGRPELSLAAFKGNVPAYIAALEQSGAVKSDPSAHSWLDTKAIERNADIASFNPSARSLVYASVYGVKRIDIYEPGISAKNSNPAVVGQIILPHTPGGLAEDRDQNLYAVVYLEGIEVFSRYNVTTPIRILQEPYAAQGISVGPDGTVYAGNTSADATGMVGISVFPPGATTQSKTLDDPSIQYVFSTAVDNQNNVYLTYSNKTTSRSAFGVFRAGSSTLTPLPLANESYVAELDAKGGVVAGNPDTASIDTYSNGSSTPSASFVTESKADYFYFDQTVGHTTIYTEPLNSASGLTGGPILEFSYPAGVQLNTIDHGDPYGFGIVTAPAPAYPPPYYPSAASKPTAAPSSVPTATACLNGAAAPKLSPSNDLLYFSAAVQCVGPGVPYNIAATVTLYNGKTGNVLDQYSGGDRAANYFKQISIPCPGLGSYYTIVTSNQAPPVRSSTSTSSRC